MIRRDHLSVGATVLSAALHGAIGATALLLFGHTPTPDVVAIPVEIVGDGGAAAAAGTAAAQPAEAQPAEAQPAETATAPASEVTAPPVEPPTLAATPPKVVETTNNEAPVEALALPDPAPQSIPTEPVILRAVTPPEITAKEAPTPQRQARPRASAPSTAASTPASSSSAIDTNLSGATAVVAPAGGGAGGESAQNAPQQEAYLAARPIGSAAGNPPPKYPDAARRRGWQGRVLLRVQVTDGGEAKSIAIVESSGRDILDQAAIDAVERWRFHPAQLGSRAVAGEAIVPVLFKLTD